MRTFTTLTGWSTEDVDHMVLHKELPGMKQFLLFIKKIIMLLITQLCIFTIILWYQSSTVKKNPFMLQFGIIPSKQVAMYIESLYISVSIRVLYVADEEQTLSNAFPSVFCICLVWLCNCFQYHWNFNGRRTQRANSTYLNTSCCICLCVLLNLIFFRIPWRRHLQTTDAKG